MQQLGGPDILAVCPGLVSLVLQALKAKDWNPSWGFLRSSSAELAAKA